MVVGRGKSGQGRDAAVTDFRDVTRRETLVIAAGALASAMAGPALAWEGPERHGMSAFGDLKYPADFKHF